MESRLVLERGGKKPWQVIHGPQRIRTLRTLPSHHWTLLVQNVDRFIPGVADLLRPFQFLPDWRVDDVMISFAPRGGTVGPHIDSYDVFLLQGQGRRRWRLDPRAPIDLRAGLDLRILKRFHAEDDWVLEPGDMLYLPPNLAHYGVALEECLTYSIGFRSPSAIELLCGVQARLMQEDLTPSRYRDPNLRMASHPAEIPRSTLRHLRTLMESSLRKLSDDDFDGWMGELLTEPKNPAWVKERPVTESALCALVRSGTTLVRSPGCRLGFIRKGQTTQLFADGHRHVLSPSLAFAASLLTRQGPLPASLLRGHLHKPGFAALLARLVSAGAFETKR